MYQGKLNDAMKLFRKVKSKKAMELPAAIGLIFAYKRQKTIDRDAIKEMEDFAKTALTRADLTALVAGARACMLTGNLTLGRSIAKRAGQRPDGVVACSALSGWLEMYRDKSRSASASLSASPKASSGSSSSASLDAASNHFQKALAGVEPSNKSLDAMLGLVEYFKRKNQYSNALNVADEIIILFEWFKPRYTIKAQLLVLASEWDQAIEVAKRALSSNSKDILALQVVVSYHLVNSGNYTEMDSSIKSLEMNLVKLEPMNGVLYLQITRCISSLCGREESVLRSCYRLMQKVAAEYEGGDAAPYIAECGKLALKLTEFKEATRYFGEASSADNGNSDVLLGLVESQIFQGQLKDASEQMEFLEAVADASNPNPLMVFLNALIVWRKRHNMDRQLKLLSTVVDLHLQALKNCGHPKNSIEWFVALDLDFLLQICQEYMQHCGTSPIMKSESPPVACVQAEDILGRLVELVPGSLACKCLLATCKFLVNDFESARFFIEKVIRCDKNFSQAQLLLARIHLYEENYAQATSTLEAAIAASFEVRDMPIYYLIKAEVERVSENVDGARVTLEQALELEGVRREVDGKHINIQDRCQVFVDLAEVYSLLNLRQEATQLIMDAKNNFKGTTEESNVAIAEAKLDRARGRADRAIRSLSLIAPESSSFITARMTMADIFLNDKRNPEKYVDCFQRIVDTRPGKTSLVLLGDALMRIQRPEEAIDAYEKASDVDPDDVDLAIQIGAALVETHDYHHAIRYYKSALATGSGPKSAKIRHALASLYLKLSKFSSASRTLDEALEQSQQDAISEIQSLQNDVKSLLLLSEVHLGINAKGKDGDAESPANPSSSALEVLHRARIVQNKVLAEVTDDEVASKVERKIASNIRFRLAKAFLLPGPEHDLGKASEALNDAIKYDKENTECIMELAKLCVKENDLGNAQQHALKLLTIDEDNIAASLMIADIMFRKTEFKAAVYHLQQMLLKKPDNYEVLSRLVSVLWRSGELNEAKAFLSRARRSSARAMHAAGYNYCKGLYFHLASDPAKAIQFLNLARRDGEWGRRAIEQMILIYLNPTGVPMWEDTEEIREDAGEAIRVIESLLREAPMYPRSEYHEVLLCYSDMLTRSKSKIDQVAHTCLKINERNKNFVPALLCMATAFMLNKQIPKARNQLKRISKLPYDPEFAADFENAYLMLSGIYIRTKKYDLAMQLCKRCLDHNKSCGKAWEDMGLIMEKETSYKDAAEYYEKAWEFDCESSAPVGYKLAFNYLKAKEFIKAIDVCYKVLAKHPKYPKIRSDILERAQYFLRN